MALSGELYRSLRQDIEADFEARRRELEDQRLRAIEALNEAWPKMGGSETDLTALATEVGDSLDKKTAVRVYQESPSISNSSSSRTVPMNAIRDEIESVLSNSETDIVTQSELKDRILRKYPNGKVPSIRAGVSRILSKRLEHGELELIEEGKAGMPNRYRKTRREEAQEPTEIETEDIALKPGS